MRGYKTKKMTVCRLHFVIYFVAVVGLFSVVCRVCVCVRGE